MLISFELILPDKILPQSRYGFDFDSKWNWEELIDNVVLINPSLIKTVDYLKKKISIEDGRIILKELSRLDSIKDVTKLLHLTKYGSADEKLKWDSLFRQSLDSISFVEDFSGLISAALLLAELKIINSYGLFEFQERSYLPQPVKESPIKFNITFDCTPAEKVIEYLDGDTTFQNEIFNAEVYQSLLSENSTEHLGRNNFHYFLRDSFEDHSLNSVYKWVNPGSLWNLGGVSIYRSNFLKVIHSVKENELNIKYDIAKRISGYLPGDIIFNVDIVFLLGEKDYDFKVDKNKLLINLEYFGDNFDYLVRYIIHKVFKIALKQIQIPIDELIVDAPDRKLVNLLSNVFENGTANYVSPVATETRPWNLLEKDFKLFNKTLKNIFKDNKFAADSLIENGYSGDAPFYTMATQIAYIIETTLGRNALVDAIELGPVEFFSKYIQAYNEYPDKIRKVFTFNDAFEERIKNLKVLFPEKIIKEAVDLKKYQPDSLMFKHNIQKFIEKNSTTENTDLVYLLSGRLMLDCRDFKDAAAMYMSGIKNKSDKGILAGKIGQTFLRENASEEALNFFDFYVLNCPKDANAYVLRGEYFYDGEEYEKAANDLEQALILNSSLYDVKSMLSKIKPHN